IKPGYERWRSGDFDAVVPTTKSAGILRNAITLSPMFSNYGPGVSTSYDRLLGDGIVGIGATAGYNGEDPFWTGRVTLGNDRARAGLGLGQTYTEDKKAVTLEIPLQYNLDEKAYVELTPGIRDMGRWKGQLDGNGFEGTKDYGQVRVGAGFRFFRF
ncbi:MAG: hypothetical protein KKG75_04925, partial [Nanoarchaeota archaeon]|nr:hypothetical protein [Nanoarchaeota archaeon]